MARRFDNFACCPLCIRHRPDKTVLIPHTLSGHFAGELVILLLSDVFLFSQDQEKKDLVSRAGLTLVQVDNWFINTRKRQWVKVRAE